jgi:uncharacterized membrane protein YgcG
MSLSLRILGVVLCFTLALADHSPADEPPLPQPIGAINDYAAILGRESRQQLQSWIDELKAKREINVVLLITLIDPYSDPPALMEKIWESWKLGAEQTIFLLLVREADLWFFQAKASPDLALPDSEYRRSIQRLLDERRVGTAAMRAVEHLKNALLEPETPEPHPEIVDSQSPETTLPQRSPSFLGSPLFWSIGAGFGLIASVIWWALLWLCPGCGSRLQRSTTRAFGRWGLRAGSRGNRRRAQERVYYCRRCGYSRVRRGER